MVCSTVVSYHKQTLRSLLTVKYQDLIISYSVTDDSMIMNGENVGQSL